jgi:hypothetical protein
MTSALVLAAALALADAPQLPAVGDVLPPFEAEAIDGRRVKVDFPKGSTTLLLFFLSGCPACHKMIPEWNQAFERKPAGLRVHGLLMDKEPPGFFIATPVSFPVLRAPTGEWRRSYKIARVPLAVRVGAGGQVLDVGVGPLDRIRVGQLFAP